MIEGEIKMAETQTMKQSERFEAAFNRIHKVLKDTLPQCRTDRFAELVQEGRGHGLIRYYERDLFQFAKLRNAMVHEKIDDGYYIAEPHKEAVEKIERIAEELEKPPTALSISSKPVCYFHEDDNLADVLKAIREHSHTRFPIYNDNEEYRWLLTATEIVQYLASHFDDDYKELENVKVRELYNKKYRHLVSFVNQHATVFDVETVFEAAQKNNKKLECIIITTKGNSSEEPNGIITPWDLLEAEMGD